jgi:hypothetical protein
MPAPSVCAAPPSWGRQPQTFTDTDIVWQELAEETRRMVAQFRATHDIWAGNPALTALLDRLTQGSS